ncbi:MAG TPA: hypothetical protein VIM31_02985 [Candidatus Microsaccharimonas sp.]|jgi:Flp pilus assembly protein TadD
MKKAKKTQKSGDKSARFSSRLSGRLGKRTIVIAVIILVILAGAVAAFMIWRNSIKSTDTTTATPLTAQQTKLVKQSGQTLDPSIAAAANAAKSEGNTANSVAIYDKAIAANSDTDEQVALYTNKAVLQASNGDVSGAIASAKKAEQLAGETLGTTSLLASLYQQSGDKVNAALYYRKAAALVDDTDGSSVGQKQYYLDTATQLEAS